MCPRVLTPMTLLSSMHFVRTTTPTPTPPPLLPQGLRYTPHSTATEQGPARVTLAWVGAPLSPFCFLWYAVCLSNPRWKLRQKTLPQSWCQGCCVAEEKEAWVQEGAQHGTCMNSLWPPSSVFPHPPPPGEVSRELQLCPQPGAGTGVALWLFTAGPGAHLVPAASLPRLTNYTVRVTPASLSPSTKVISQ